MVLRSDLDRLQPGINQMTSELFAKDAAKADVDNKLKQLLAGKQADLQNQVGAENAQAGMGIIPLEQQGKLNEVKATSDAAIATDKGKTANSLQGLRNMQDAGLAPDGSSMKVGDTAVGVDPTYKMLAAQQKGGANAIQKASDLYNKGLPKLQQTASAAAEGLDLINDPHQTASLGSARTLALKAFGMNRYNNDEAKAVVPPALQGTFAQLFNSSGDDQNPLNEAQKRSLNSLFSGTLQHVHEQHDLLKQNALSTYNLNPYSDPSKSQTLQGQLGKPYTDFLDTKQKKYSSLPTTTSPVEQRPAPTGAIDKLFNLLKGNSNQGPSKPKTVIQGGHTYTLNPATGQYE